MDARIKSGHDKFPPAARFASGLLQNSVPPSKEGAGNAGRRLRPQPCVQNKKHTSVVTTVTPAIPAFPARWFYGFLRSLPGDRAFCLRRRPQCASIVANLAPASGCQDATTSPSASRITRQLMGRRPSHPAPTFVTIAKRPLWWRGTRGNLPVICPSSQATIPAADWHDGQISCGALWRVKGRFIPGR